MKLQDFVYELHRYADQTHVLKDKFEKLSDTEKKLVMDAAPPGLSTPEEYFQPVYQWLETVNKLMEN
ncbi:hypothetical protein [Oceanobacillus saliphilus]|uniref:hypothetical protein n=1 Tax=Oceanobacillus saliphilus TaxID=2925834 RepID=UPI00201DB6D2|nr:hypothetical protein [Oceanobacillus saliphilus]